MTRLSYRAEHAEAARLTAGWMREAGAEVGVDRWGNLLLDGLCAEIGRAASAAAGRYGLEVEHHPWWSEPPLPLDPRVRGEVTEAARDLGWPMVTMPSWAGHDAKVLAGVAPSGMIFVPSVRGISHSPLEETAWEDAARGAQVLCRALERLDAWKGG